MHIEQAAASLAELGHKTRLQIFKQLVKGGRQGLPVGDIQSELGIPGSTLTHHLTRLASVGLIKQQRDGRIIYCIPQYDKLDTLIGFLQEECCINEGLRK